MAWWPCSVKSSGTQALSSSCSTILSMCLSSSWSKVVTRAPTYTHFRWQLKKDKERGAKQDAGNSKEVFLKPAQITSSLAGAQSCDHTEMQGSLRSGVFISQLPCSLLKCGTSSLLILREKGRLGTGNFALSLFFFYFLF